MLYLEIQVNEKTINKRKRWINTYKYTRAAKNTRTISLCLDPSWLNKKITAASFNISNKSIWNAIWNLLTTTCLWGAGCCCWGCCPACPWFSLATVASELGLLLMVIMQLQKQLVNINEHICSQKKIKLK